MFEIKVQHSFPAGHSLRNYPGKCANVHGHNYRAIVTIAGPSLNEHGLLVDFSDVKRELRAICDRLDHQYLNEIPPFDAKNPTAENIARYLCEELSSALRAHPVQVKKVEVWETDTAAAIYKASE